MANRSPTAWNKWKREPLLHFLLLGGILFGVEYLRKGSSGEVSELVSPIVVESGEIEGLLARFEGEYFRPPTETEREDLVRKRIQEELFYREALNRNLDEDDPIIRQHLAEEMQYLIEDLEVSLDPTEKDLRDFYESHPEQFSSPARISFQQVFLDPSKRSKEGVLSAAEELLERLGKEQDARSVSGDIFHFPARIRASEADLVRYYGTSFVEKISSLEERDWTGPWESHYGYHLVRILSVSSPELMPFDRIESEVRLAWIETNKTAARERWTEELRERYPVRVEWPESMQPISKDTASKPSTVPES